jgi:hypothetical protein
MRSGVLDLKDERRWDKTMGVTFSRNELRDVKRCDEVLIENRVIFEKPVLVSLA